MLPIPKSHPACPIKLNLVLLEREDFNDHTSSLPSKGAVPHKVLYIDMVANVKGFELPGVFRPHLAFPRVSNGHGFLPIHQCFPPCLVRVVLPKGSRDRVPDWTSKENHSRG